MKLLTFLTRGPWPVASPPRHPRQVGTADRNSLLHGEPEFDAVLGEGWPIAVPHSFACEFHGSRRDAKRRGNGGSPSALRLAQGHRHSHHFAHRVHLTVLHILTHSTQVVHVRKHRVSKELQKFSSKFSCGLKRMSLLLVTRNILFR